MIYRQAHRGGVWVDLENPSDEEIRDAAKEFGVSERLETELLAPSPFPLVANESEAALVVLHFPAHGADHEAQDGGTENQEIDFIVGKGFVITVRYEVVAPLHRLRKLLESQELSEGSADITTETLVEILFAHLYAAVREHTNHIADRLTRVEREMFDGHERHTVRQISGVNREYLHLEASLANQEEPLSRFLATLAHSEFFGEHFEERRTRILTERGQVARLLSTHRAVATELRETNSALLEARQNEIMKALTMLTVIVLPLELIAFVFAMHVPGQPLEHNPQAFEIIMGMMLGAVALILIYFAKKRWLF